MRRTDETNNTQNVLNDTIDFTKPKVLSKKITVDGEKHDVKTSSSFTVKNNNSKKTQNMNNIAREETLYLANLPIISLISLPSGSPSGYSSLCSLFVGSKS